MGKYTKCHFHWAAFFSFLGQILGVFDWSGSNSMPIPPFFPSHAPRYIAKMWCYCCMVYMPMSYLYGERFVGQITPLVLQLRDELHTQPYDTISWARVRHRCTKVKDLYYPHPLVQDLLWDGLYIFTEPFLTRWPFNKLREKALQVTMNHIHYEDENNRYITIGGVEKQLADEIGLVLARGHDFIKKSQVKDNPSGDFRSMYRQISKGSWDFFRSRSWLASVGLHSRGIEVLSVLLSDATRDCRRAHETRAFARSVNVILSLQSENGGLAAWEPAGLRSWLDVFHPTEFLADIMVEHDYVECTVSAIQAFVRFKELHPGHRQKEIDNFIEKAVGYIEGIQMPDGSWCVNWGVCFTYGTWFALGGLAAARKTCDNCSAMRKGVSFLLKSQLDDGGWGESYRSCLNKVSISEVGPSARSSLFVLPSEWDAEMNPMPLHRAARAHQFADGERGLPPTGDHGSIQ
ncbi:hypothetical protein MLD38_029167 [Melastoma candidum]|uniref:Uncharacterized protein n=1 Tax=Melastoma candidum TaxID=119954 RepID=A0ACB9N426_9MYRT|nr:hypothetical protein MLD38_029167 [Melastoma candidum]